MRVSDIEDLGLPDEVVAAATVDSNGEVRWPVDQAPAAISALADAGQVILGLDVRAYEEDGRFIEVAWSSFEPDGYDDIEHGRDAALVALQRPDPPGESILVTWRSNR